MNFFFKNHKIYLLVLTSIILIGCQLQEASKNHGITFLKNRSEKPVIDNTNKNDVLKIIGHPHSKSINNENEWLYFERTLIKGQFHKLGKNILKENNVLILNFNNYGILVKKEFLDKNSKNKLRFSEKITKNDLSQKSFVERFLTSIKSKMYGSK